MTILAKGGNTTLSGNDLNVSVRWRTSDSRGPDIDASAFLLGTTGKVLSDAGMVFHGQGGSSGCDAVSLTSIAQPEADQTKATNFSLALRQIPDRVERIALTATIDDSVKRGVSFAQVESLSILAFDNGAVAAQFDVPVSGASECALTLGEVYRRNGQWKFRAVGQGFNGGLKPLAEFYGVQVADSPAPVSPSPVPRVAPPSSPPSVIPPASPPAPPINLSKITLSKAKPSVDLTKKGSSFGQIKVNLNWNRGTPKMGLFGFKRSSGAVDLDLGCLFELQDGGKGCVQALGNSFGNIDAAPYIQLLGDDRTGANTDGEWLRINGEHWPKIKRVLLYAFIYEGVPNWSATDGVITLYVPGSPSIDVRLQGESSGGMCAIALIENVGGQIRVNREVRYFNGHAQTDSAYGWGMRWVTGSKD